jgi:hypothetical protein
MKCPSCSQRGRQHGGGGGMMVLIACHCDLHYRVHHHTMYQPTLALTPNNYPKLGYNDVIYVDIDPRCPINARSYREWGKIPDLSIDLIWPLYCPLGQYFNESNKIPLDLADTLFWLTLLGQGHRILKSNGYIGLLVDNPYPEQLDRLNQLIDIYSSRKLWEIKTIRPPPFYFEGERVSSYKHFKETGGYLIKLIKLKS